MSGKHRITAWAAITTVALLVACGGTESAPTAVAEITAPPPPSATPQPTPTATPLPTATPTHTPSPTATPEPTATPTNTPTPTPEPLISLLVTDAESGEPVAGVDIQLVDEAADLRLTAVTDEEGYAQFDLVPAGDYALTLVAHGYEPLAMEALALTGYDELSYALTPLVLASVTAEQAVLRAGPGTVYNRMGTVDEGMVLEIIGQNERGDWYQVLVIPAADDAADAEAAREPFEAWIAAENVSVSGDLETIVAVAPPATPTPAPPQPTATPAQVDTVTLFYRSNPNEVLGTFPVYSFDARALYNNMVRLRNNLQTMQGVIGAARNGDAAACQSYVNSYNGILYSGTFYDDVPADWGEIHAAYIISFIYALDRTRPAYLSCVNAGTVDEFNYSLAVQTLGETLGFFTPYVNTAAAKVGG